MRYINDNIAVTDIRIAQFISEDEFKQKLCDAVKTHCSDSAYRDYLSEADDEILPWSYAVSMLLNRSNRIRMEKDIKVDHENIELSWDDWDTKLSGTAEPAKYLGIHTINGLTFCGALTGGDWENCVFLILYWDGEDIHVYIPKRGNAVNMDAMTAFGSEGDEFEYWGWKYDDKLSSLGKIALDKYKKLGICAEKTEEVLDEFEWSKFYIQQYGYDLDENGYVDVTYNWEAMMEEIFNVFTVKK